MSVYLSVHLLVHVIIGIGSENFQDFGHIDWEVPVILNELKNWRGVKILFTKLYITLITVSL